MIELLCKFLKFIVTPFSMIVILIFVGALAILYLFIISLLFDGLEKGAKAYKTRKDKEKKK